MSGTKIFWGQITVVFLIVLIFIWSGTQWTAWRLGFQPQLGPAWFDLYGIPVYYPPALFWWWYFCDAYAPRIFMEGGIIAASGGFLAIAIAILMSVWRARAAQFRRRRAWQARRGLPASQWPGTCALLRANPLRQGRHPRLDLSRFLSGQVLLLGGPLFEDHG